MWSALKQQHQLYAIITLTAIAIFGYQGLSELWSDGKIPLSKAISTSVFLIGTILVITFNWTWRWLWKKIPKLNELVFPDLNGHWVGHLQTTWKDPTTSQSPGPIAAEIWIEQSLLSMNVRQKTKESNSYSTRLIPEPDRNADAYRIWFTYTNKPKSNLYYRSI